MFEVHDSGGATLPKNVTDVITLSEARVDDFRIATDAFMEHPIARPEEQSVQRVLNIGNYVYTLVNAGELYLRNLESISNYQLDTELDTLSVFNASERARTTLKRAMVGFDFEPNVSMSGLYNQFRGEYLPRLARTARSVFSENIHSKITVEHEQEAIGIANYIGKAALMPVVRVSSVLFEEALRAGNNGIQDEHALRYFTGNLEAAHITYAYDNN